MVIFIAHLTSYFHKQNNMNIKINCLVCEQKSEVFKPPRLS